MTDQSSTTQGQGLPESSISPKIDPRSSISPKVVVVKSKDTLTVSKTKAKASSSPIVVPIHNTDSKDWNWTATVIGANWVTLSHSNGNLAPGQQTTLQANVNVSSLPVGTETFSVKIVSNPQASSVETITVNVQA